MNFRILCAIAILVLAGCATRQDAPPSQITTSGDSDFKDSSNVESSAITTAAMLAEEAMKSVEPSIYFDYDKFEIKENYQKTISAFADYLRTHPDSKILIEGNCDERGTIEYNLALGQKRADAVSSALEVVGIRASRVETISNGEEKPRNSIRSEAGYSVNRRADLIIR